MKNRLTSVTVRAPDRSCCRKDRQFDELLDVPIPQCADDESLLPDTPPPVPPDLSDIEGTDLSFFVILSTLHNPTEFTASQYDPHPENYRTIETVTVFPQRPLYRECRLGVGPLFQPSATAIKAASETPDDFLSDGKLSAYPWRSWTEAAMSILRSSCNVPDRVMNGFIEVIQHAKFRASDITSLSSVKVQYNKNNEYNN